MILSSHAIPGNEEIVYRTINRLFQRGVDVIYEPLAPVHVSGHASQEEMKLMINLVKPEYLIPIHGELRHLKQHAALGVEMGVPEENIAVVENGRIIEFSNGEMEIGERIPGGYIFVDGSRVLVISDQAWFVNELHWPKMAWWLSAWHSIPVGVCLMILRFSLADLSINMMRKT